MSWPSIAAKYRITDRQARRIVAEFRESDPSLLDTNPVEVVEEMIRAHDAAIDELVHLADRTANDSVRLGALKTRLQAIQSKLALMQALGVLPHDLGGVRVHVEAVEVGRTIVEVLDRHGMPEVVMDEILSVVEGGSTRAGVLPSGGVDSWPDPVGAS
jgi:hypothetical protein